MTSRIANLQTSLEKRRTKKREGLEKIMVLAERKRVIKNNDVELLLHVTDATATRYLSELVQTGRLQRRGAQKQPHYVPQAPSV